MELYIFFILLLLICPFVLWFIYFMMRQNRVTHIRLIHSTIQAHQCEVILIYGNAHARITAELLAQTLRSSNESVASIAYSELYIMGEKSLQDACSKLDVIIVYTSASHAAFTDDIQLLQPQTVAFCVDTDIHPSVMHRIRNYSGALTILAPVTNQRIFSQHTAHSLVGYGNMQELAHVRVEAVVHNVLAPVLKRTQYRVNIGRINAVCDMKTALTNLDDAVAIVVAIATRRGYGLQRVLQQMSSASGVVSLPFPHYGINHTEMIDLSASTWLSDVLGVKDYVKQRSDLEGVLFIQANTLRDWMNASHEDSDAQLQLKNIYEECFVLDASRVDREKMYAFMRETNDSRFLHFRSSSALTRRTLLQTLTPQHCVVVAGGVSKRLLNALSEV